MAMYQSSVITPSVSATRNHYSSISTPSAYISSPISVTAFPVNLLRFPNQRTFSRSRGRVAMAHQAVRGAPATYAKDMERLSAKESLLLALRSPVTLANLTKLDVVIKDVSANITANFKLFNSIESRFMLSTVLTVEGPLRIKEEYIEGVLESPQVNQDAIPEQLRGLFGQAATTVQQLPVPVKDVMARGLTIPLSGTFQRLFLISYLDDEILIIRDIAGAPEVLTRIDMPIPIVEPTTEYVS